MHSDADVKRPLASAGAIVDEGKRSSFGEADGVIH